MTGPYYRDELVTLYCGDAIDILPGIENDAAELALTDPPYNFGVDYGQYKDALADDVYRVWCATWFGELRRIAKRTVVFPGHGNIPTWTTIRKPSLFGCWYKPGNPAGGGVVQFCEWEPWLYWGPFIGGSDVVRATITRQRDTGDHPCPKPPSLMKQLITRMKAASVLDPFAGSGTTLVAAKFCGASAIGIEIDEGYCEIAARRLSQGVLDFEDGAA